MMKRSWWTTTQEATKMKITKQKVNLLREKKSTTFAICVVNPTWTAPRWNITWKHMRVLEIVDFAGWNTRRQTRLCVPGVRESLLPQRLSCCAREDALGRETLPLWDLWQGFQPEPESGDPQVKSHRRETLSLLPVQQTLRHKQRPQPTLKIRHGGEALLVWRLWQKVLQQRSGEEA